MRLSESQRKAREESGLPCAYKAAQNFPREKYLGKPAKRTVLTGYGKGLIVLLAITTLAGGFYWIYSETVNDLLGGFIR